MSRIGGEGSFGLGAGCRRQRHVIRGKHELWLGLVFPLVTGGKRFEDFQTFGRFVGAILDVGEAAVDARFIRPLGHRFLQPGLGLGQMFLRDLRFSLASDVGDADIIVNQRQPDAQHFGIPL